MIHQRTLLYGLLAVVAAAAAVLSFAALRDLALLCGFSPWLAWLLPVVIDAGAAAGSLAWLRSAPALVGGGWGVGRGTCCAGCAGSSGDSRGPRQRSHDRAAADVRCGRPL